MTLQAIVATPGGPEAIEWVEVDLPPPGPGEARVRNTVVGLNYLDVYYRTGLYPVPLPTPLGAEAAGVVEAVGAGVRDLKPGDRVACFGPALGTYATERNVPARELFRLPDDVSDEVAAAVFLKGCTTEAAVERCARAAAGQTALVWAAAGGVGHLMVGWLRAIGVRVIGVVGSDEKAEHARRNGADHVLDHRCDDVAGRVREITDGRGVEAVFDGVGQASWPASLASAARRGIIVSFGNAGGPVTGVALQDLARGGSLFVTRMRLFDYYVTDEERAAGVDRLFAMLRGGGIRPEIGATFPLRDAAAAHRALEGGETRGSTLLIV